MTRRLLLGLLAFAAIVLALLVVPLGISGQRNERNQLTNKLERDALAAASMSVDLLADPDGDSAGARRDALLQQLDDYAAKSGGRVVVVDGAGTSIVDTGETDRPVVLGRDFSTRPEVAAALGGKVESGERGSDTLGHPLLYVAAPVASGGQLLGAVRISHPANELDARIRRQWTALASTSLAVLGVASLAALLVAAWIGRPLAGIAEAADRVGGGDLAARADTANGPPEVRAVAERLNASVAAVERMFQDQRDFTADASHQLRTPLHALTLRLENASLELEGGDTAAAAQDIERAAADVARLASLVEGLLALERADRDSAGAVEPADVACVFTAREADWRERAQRSQVELRVDLPGTGELVVLARELHVEQVLDNYVQNAITAAGAGGHVTVAVARAGDMVELHVLDDGPGMNDDELELAFRRFHSGADRPRGDGAGGFGLGLAIVRRLAQLDDGHAELRHAGPDGRARSGIDAVVAYPAA